MDEEGQDGGTPSPAPRSPSPSRAPGLCTNPQQGPQPPRMVPLHPRCLPSSTLRGDAPSWGSPRAQLIAPTTPAGFQQAEKAAKHPEIRNPEAFPSAKPQPLQEAAPGDKKGLSTGEPRRKTARAPIEGNTTGPHTGVGTSWPSYGGLVPPGTGWSSEG